MKKDAFRGTLTDCHGDGYIKESKQELKYIHNFPLLQIATVIIGRGNKDQN
jgi:hypothetical protein